MWCRLSATRTGMNSVHAACDLLLSAPTNSTSFRLWESSSLRHSFGELKFPSSQAVLRYRTAIATFFRENFGYTEVLSFWVYTFSKAQRGSKANNGNIVGDRLKRFFCCCACPQNAHLRLVNCAFSDFARLKTTLFIQPRNKKWITHLLLGHPPKNSAHGKGFSLRQLEQRMVKRSTGVARTVWVAKSECCQKQYYSNIGFLTWLKLLALAAKSQTKFGFCSLTRNFSPLAGD